MRKLAHIEQIAWLRPIEGADKIELAGILGWQCIVKKNEFKVGDLAIYVEIDSIMPSDNPDFAFLESKHYKIKTMKMRGVISQGIIFPLSVLHDGKTYDIGDDVTDTLKIKQVEDDVPKQQVKDPAAAIKQRHKKLFKNKVFLWFMKFKWFRKTVYKLLAPKKKPKNFPDWIVKTDETRLQNMPFVLDTYKDKPMVVTEKLDGTSTSFGLRKEKKRKENMTSQCVHGTCAKPTSTKSASTMITFIIKSLTSTASAMCLCKYLKNIKQLQSFFKAKPLARQFRKINTVSRELISMPSTL